jgi:hypothetical protein
MQYHEPAEWWQLYDLHDFESYCREFVIRGRFHKSVPQVIIEEYLLAEYMMAHAYYHPPLYDEAYSKMLRIVEKAVKLRCTQLGLKTNKILAALIDDITIKEPTKGLKDLLHKLRMDRNAYMHASIESDQGGLLRARMRRCVVMLNVLFMDEQYFLKTHEHKLQMMDIMEPFKEGVFAVSLLDHNVLAEAILLTAVDHTGKGWVYCLHIATVPKEVDNVLSTGYPEWKPFPVKDLVINTTGITARMADLDKPITITRTNHPVALEHLRKYNTIRNQASEQYIKEAEFSLAMHLEIDMVKWGYEWGWQATDI